MRLKHSDGSLNIGSTTLWEALLTVAQVSKMLNIRPKTIYLWCALRIIPHYRFGGSIRFKLEEIEAWVKSCQCPPLSDYNNLTVTGSPIQGRRKEIDGAG